MQIVVVPNELSAAINARLDSAIKACPDAEVDRESLYKELLRYFDEYGVIPEFTLEKAGKP